MTALVIRFTLYLELVWAAGLKKVTEKNPCNWGWDCFLGARMTGGDTKSTALGFYSFSSRTAGLATN